MLSNNLSAITYNINARKKKKITFRVGVTGISVYAPCVGTVGVTGVVGVVGGLVGFGVGVNSSTSAATILPLGPVPWIADKSTPLSLANFLAYGLAIILPSAFGCSLGTSCFGASFSSTLTSFFGSSAGCCIAFPFGV